VPRLNLDIFSSTNDTDKEEKPRPVIKPDSVQASVAKTPSAQLENSDEGVVPSPKFVPVGFHERHLRALDDAVHSLRKKGLWKASKSAIIRGLIDAHVDELERFVPQPSCKAEKG
jgi:hypothetical protein